MVFPIVGGTQSTGYEVSNSLRFNDGDSPELTFTPSSAGTQTKFTISLWFKLGNITSTRRVLFGAGDDYLRIADDDNIQWHVTDNGGTARSFYAPAKIRDPSAWYHVVAQWDTTQGTDTNRMRLWTNGVEQTANSFTRPSQNATSQTLNSAAAHKLGGELNPSNDFHFDGYISEFYFIDGYAYDYQDFGKFDDNGVWIPKDFTGSYGSNGIRLEFKQTGTSQNSSGIGADTSGNDNHFAVTNLAATDVTEDTCTNNFATLNPLDRAVENASGGITLSEGNCKSVGPNGGNRSRAQSTIGFSSGKWYAEFKIVNGNDHKTQIGMIDEVQSTTNHGGVNAGVEYRTNDDYIYSFTDGSENSNQGSLTGVSNNDIVGVAINADTSPPSIQFYLNGNTQGSAVTYPNTGSIYFFFSRDGSDSGNDEPEVLCNFGNPPYTISSGNNDGKYGNFEYAPPSGYYALCTKRLAEFG